MRARLTHDASQRYTHGVRPQKRVVRAVYAAFTIIAAAFIVSSTWQIARAVFADGATAGAAETKRISPACAESIRTLVAAVDRGIAAAAAPSGGDDAEERYRRARGKDWEEAKQRELGEACRAAPGGPEAMAAVRRLDRVAEGSLRRQSNELRPVRRAVDSFIR